jgi:hypothetical protein
MIKDESICLAFLALGVCPEDVLVVLPVAQLICDAEPQLAGKLNAVVLRRSIKALVDRHLLQGNIASGVQMHDVVRDLVRSRLGGEDGIRVKQRAVVRAFVAACPAGGWPSNDAVGQYAALALATHMAEAMFPNLFDDEEAQAWLLHSEEAIVSNIATVLGSAKLSELSAAKEAAGDLVGAARVAWAARSVKQLPAARSVELAYRTVALLESANDPNCITFEVAVLGKAIAFSFKGEAIAFSRRLALLASSGATFASKRGEFLGAAGPALGVLFAAGMAGWPYNVAEVRSAFFLFRQATQTHMVEASRLSDVTWEQQMACLVNAMSCIWSASTCDMDDWNPLLCGGEAALEEALAHYTQTNGQCGKDMQSKDAGGRDDYRFGQAGVLLALFFGNLPPIAQWAVDATAAYNELDLPETRNYVAQYLEVWESRSACSLLVSLNRLTEAHALLEAMGFTWSDAGFALYDSFFAALSQVFPCFVKDADAVFHRLVLYLASPQTAALDAEVSAWIPAPAALAQHERDQFYCQHWGLKGLLDVAAAAFLQLGRDDDAAEVARILVSPEHHCVQHRDLARAHSVLGQVAAKRGNVEEADGHFGRALESATASRFPLLEVLAARDWKRAAGAGASAAVVADAAIDAACVKMGKSRDQLSSVL